MTKTTHIETIRQRSASVKLQVQNLLGWDDLEYANFQEEKGSEYLTFTFGMNTSMLDSLKEFKEFWSWWRMHWLRRDQEFLSLTHLLFTNEYEVHYRMTHKASSVSFRPHAVIMEKTYRKMMNNQYKNS